MLKLAAIPPIDVNLHYCTSIVIPHSIILASMKIETDEQTWQHIERIEVVVGNSSSLMNLSRRGLELLNRACVYGNHVVPIAAYWKRLGMYNGEIGLIINHVNLPTILKLYTDLKEEKSARINVSGYEIPLRYPPYNFDNRWFVTHQEEFSYGILAGMTHYIFPPNGVIMTVIVDGMEEPPHMTLGANMPIIIEPMQIEKSTWSFDFTTDKPIIENSPGKAPMRILDSQETANICVHYSQPVSKKQIRIITRRAHVIY